MTVRTIDINEAINPLAQYAQQVATGPLVITVEGQPVAVIMAFENMDMETVALSNHPQFLATIERSRQRQRNEGGLSTKEMRARLAVKPKQRNHRKVNHD
jgi:antitoxin (DNA-binding transcriptional repressor) of toxin-antitoxin stability system